MTALPNFKRRRHLVLQISPWLCWHGTGMTGSLLQGHQEEDHADRHWLVQASHNQWHGSGNPVGPILFVELVAMEIAVFGRTDPIAVKHFETLNVRVPEFVLDLDGTFSIAMGFPGRPIAWIKSTCPLYLCINYWTTATCCILGRVSRNHLQPNRQTLSVHECRLNSFWPAGANWIFFVGWSFNVCCARCRSGKFLNCFPWT